MSKLNRSLVLIAVLIISSVSVYYLFKGDNNSPEVQIVSEQESETVLKDNQAPKGSINQLAKPKTGDEVAVISTSKGDITVRLFPEAVPETVKNFTELARYGKYNDAPFHRVIRDFMIQTGDFEKGNGMGGYSYKGENTKIDDEFHPDLSNLRGAVSMANSGPNTNGSQFFIVQAKDGTPHLNNVHSVFGQVIEGMDVVDEIANSKVDTSDRPVEKITITNIILKKY